MKKTLINLINIPNIQDDGVLCFMEQNNHIPFEIKRVYYILGCKHNEVRGKHAHKKTNQVLFCIQGSVDMFFTDGTQEARYTLTKPHEGILLDHGVWHEMHNIKQDTVLLVIASETFNEEDYIRNYDDFLKFIKLPSHES